MEKQYLLFTDKTGYSSAKSNGGAVVGGIYEAVKYDLTVDYHVQLPERFWVVGPWRIKGVEGFSPEEESWELLPEFKHKDKTPLGWAERMNLGGALWKKDKKYPFYKEGETFKVEDENGHLNTTYLTNNNWKLFYLPETLPLDERQFEVTSDPLVEKTNQLKENKMTESRMKPCCKRIVFLYDNNKQYVAKQVFDFNIDSYDLVGRQVVEYSCKKGSYYVLKTDLAAVAVVGLENETTIHTFSPHVVVDVEKAIRMNPVKVRKPSTPKKSVLNELQQKVDIVPAVKVAKPKVTAQKPKKVVTASPKKVSLKSIGVKKKVK